MVPYHQSQFLSTDKRPPTAARWECTQSTAMQGQAQCPSKARTSFPAEDGWHGVAVQDHSTVLSPRTEPWQCYE